MKKLILTIIISIGFINCQNSVSYNEQNKEYGKIGVNVQFCKPIVKDFIYYYPIKENMEIQMCDENGLCSRFNETYVTIENNEYKIKADKNLYLCEYKTK